MIRPNVLHQHQREVVSSLFAPFNDQIKQTFNCDLATFQNEIDNILAQSTKNIEECRDVFQRIKRLGEMGISKISPDSPQVRDLFPDFDAVPDKLSQNIFEVKPSTITQKNIIGLLSHRFGENVGFSKPDQWKYWPLNPSILTLRPLVFHFDKYYLFCPLLLLRNLDKILFHILRTGDAMFEAAFLKNRADFLEQKPLDILTKLLPSAKQYKNLFYSKSVDGVVKHFEIDGLITFDEHLFLVSSKSGAANPKALRGHPEALKRLATDLISDGATQLALAKDYIQEFSTRADFFDRKDIQLVSLERKAYKHIHLINVTLENLGFLAAQSFLLEEAKLLEEVQSTWTVSIYDLWTISAILESPSEFLLYCERRVSAGKNPHLFATDELDFFGYFLDRGLYFENENLENLKVVTTGLTENIEIYLARHDLQIDVPKPTLNVSAFWRSLIRKIEDNPRLGFTAITRILLGLSGQIHAEVETRLKEMVADTSKSGCHHDLKIPFPNHGWGITVGTKQKHETESSKKSKTLSRLRKYQLQLPKWYFIELIIENDQIIEYDFIVFETPWIYDIREEQALKLISKALITAAKSKGKIGRNAPCPCNSTKKYKDCCESL